MLVLETRPTHLNATGESTRAKKVGSWEDQRTHDILCIMLATDASVALVSGAHAGVFATPSRTGGSFSALTLTCETETG